MKPSEEVRDELHSLIAMTLSLITQMVTCVGRGVVSENMKKEMLTKLSWLADRIKEI